MESNTGTGPAGEEQDVRETAFCVGDTSTYATLVDGACVCLWVCVFCLEGFCVHSIKKDDLSFFFFFLTLVLVMLATCPPLCIFDYYELVIIICT